MKSYCTMIYNIIVIKIFCLMFYEDMILIISKNPKTPGTALINYVFCWIKRKIFGNGIYLQVISEVYTCTFQRRFLKYVIYVLIDSFPLLSK